MEGKLDEELGSTVLIVDEVGTAHWADGHVQNPMQPAEPPRDLTRLITHPAFGPILPSIPVCHIVDHVRWTT